MNEVTLDELWEWQTETWVMFASRPGPKKNIRMWARAGWMEYKVTCGEEILHQGPYDVKALRVFNEATPLWNNRGVRSGRTSCKAPNYSNPPSYLRSHEAT